MWLKTASDQTKSSDEQHKHNESIEKADRTEIDMQIGEDAREDKECPGHCKNPTENASAAPEEQTNSEQHWQESDAKGVFSKEIPIGAYNRNLVDQQISAKTGHDGADNKMTQAAGRAAYIAESTVLHDWKDADSCGFHL
ncbi:MAG: hypothetical protein WBQ94_05215 [Terracidiphilus sp.]